MKLLSQGVYISRGRGACGQFRLEIQHDFANFGALEKTHASFERKL